MKVIQTNRTTFQSAQRRYITPVSSLCLVTSATLYSSCTFSPLSVSSIQARCCSSLQYNMLITQLVNLMSPLHSSSKQNEWIMSGMMALWIRLPIVILLWLFDLPYWNVDDCPINNAKSWFPSGEAGKEIHLAYRWKWAVAFPSQPVAQSSFIIHRTKQTINSAAMYEGWRDATSCEWWGAKNQRPHSFLALMAITSPDSTSKMRLIICTDPFKEDWLDLMPS